MNPQISEVLDRARAEINPTDDCPFDVHGVARRLGLSIRRAHVEAGKRLEGYLELSKSPAIVVALKTDGTPPPFVRERFTIAHELGHWAIWRRLQILPDTHERYWEHETHCNLFAARLLVPDSVALRKVQDLQQARILPLFFPSHLAHHARVSWDVAARVIGRLDVSGYAYLQIAGTDKGAAVIVVVSAVADDQGRIVGQYAKSRDPQLVELMKLAEPGHVSYVELEVRFGRLELALVPCMVVKASRERQDRLLLCFQIGAPGVQIHPPQR